MRQKWILLLTIGLFAVFAGCAKDPASMEVNQDEETIRQLIEENMDYITTAGLDDDGAQPVQYSTDGLGKLSTEITPLKFGRRGKFEIDQITIDYEGDLAIATINYTYNGNFFVVADDPDDSVSFGTLYKKEMENNITRQAIFRKEANSNYPKRNWRMKRVSGSELRSPNTGLVFEWIKVSDDNGNEWTFDNPLAFVNDLEAIPTLTRHSHVTIQVKLAETSAPADTILLRYRANRMHRARKSLNDSGEGPDKVAGDGIYTGEWMVRGGRGIYHAFVDAFEEGSISDDVAPYNALAWGFTYFVKM